ncbi:hypothetical protein KUCAC02_016030, partial [Chaenocephalus aceratus]
RVTRLRGNNLNREAGSRQPSPVACERRLTGPHPSQTDTVGHCGAGRFCFGAPTPGSKAQSAAICWTSAVPAANVLNNATSTMNSVPWQKEGAQSGAG